MSFADEKEIVRRVLGGEKAAFGYLIDRHRSEALGFAARLLNPLDAEDVVQEAFLAAFLSLPKLRDHERFCSWLLGIAANLCRSRLRLRREGYWPDVFGGEAVPGVTLEDLEPSPELAYETKEIHQMLRGAIQALSLEQRETVALHYIQGLRISEIAILSGVATGTVKARLHRARIALRKALLAEIEGAGHESFDGGLNMIELCVQDVAVRTPKDDPGKWLASGKDYKLDFFRVILLKEVSGDRILPIWVGPGEGDLIAMQLEHIEWPRPTTFDLTANLLKLGNVQIEKVAVTALREGTYFATMWIRANGAVHEVDARPSDAITLALHADAPIFVTPETLTAANSISVDSSFEQLQEQTSKAQKEGVSEPDPKPMEWRSFRSLERGTF